MNTFNRFKQELKQMNQQERESKLRELQATLMYEKTQSYGMGQGRGEQKIWVLRKMVAITKTAIKNWR